MHVFQFRAANLFRFSSVKIPISLSQQVYQVQLVNKEYIEWGLAKGYEYIQIRLI